MTKSKEIIYQIKIKSKEITILHLFQMLNIITFGEKSYCDYQGFVLAL